MKLAGKIGTKGGLLRMFDHLNSMCKEGTKLCLFGHNIGEFDLKVLWTEAKRHNLSDKLTGISFVDTLQVVKDHGTWASQEKECPSSLALGYLHKYLIGEDIPSQHSAVGDVLANAKILQILDKDLSISCRFIKALEFE